MTASRHTLETWASCYKHGSHIHPAMQQIAYRDFHSTYEQHKPHGESLWSEEPSPLTGWVPIKSWWPKAQLAIAACQ